MEKTGLSKQAAISELTRSPHGDLMQYAPVGAVAAVDDPNFFSHLIAWNEQKGQIRDSKVALPVIALSSKALVEDAELRDNALAHIVGLAPRDMLRAIHFAKNLAGVSRRLLYRHVEKYIRDLEAQPGRFERVALQHRATLVSIYSLLHLKPDDYAKRVLQFKDAKGKNYAPVGLRAEVASLKNMLPDEIAGTIMRRNIPFLIAAGALGVKAKDPAVVQALIGAMSPTELVTNTKLLERLGMKENPALRAAYEAGLQKVAKSTKATLKTSVAAAAVGGKLGEKMLGTQEKQLDNMAVEGDWLILADKSSSMKDGIEVARQVAAIVARVAKGKTYLVWFDGAPYFHDVTGKSLEDISKLTKHVSASGGTNIGCGLDYINQRKLIVDGIAVVSDGGDGYGSLFPKAYAAHTEASSKEVPVYFYKLAGDPDRFTGNVEAAGIQMQTFDLTKSVDYYALPNIVQTMRTNRYSLIDEIMATPLKTLKVKASAPQLEPVTET
jgi:hypothetical protein